MLPPQVYWSKAWMELACTIRRTPVASAASATTRTPSVFTRQARSFFSARVITATRW
ncbi:hypothetical protein CJ469_06440 [Nocardia farcinica]|nr:hypothetical protein CJ469_06440 [Nocardia farcinica]